MTKDNFVSTKLSLVCWEGEGVKEAPLLMIKILNPSYIGGGADSAPPNRFSVFPLKWLLQPA